MELFNNVGLDDFGENPASGNNGTAEYAQCDGSDQFELLKNQRKSLANPIVTKLQADFVPRLSGSKKSKSRRIPPNEPVENIT